MHCDQEHYTSRDGKSDSRDFYASGEHAGKWMAKYVYYATGWLA